MRRPITRRAAAKLLLYGPAALALPRELPAATPVKKGSDGLTASERRRYEKSVGQIRDVARKIRETKVEIGTEPPFVFRPLFSKK